MGHFITDSIIVLSQVPVNTVILTRLPITGGPLLVINVLKILPWNMGGTDHKLGMRRIPLQFLTIPVFGR